MTFDSQTMETFLQKHISINQFCNLHLPSLLMIIDHFLSSNEEES